MATATASMPAYSTTSTEHTTSQLSSFRAAASVSMMVPEPTAVSWLEWGSLGCWGSSGEGSDLPERGGLLWRGLLTVPPSGETCATSFFPARRKLAGWG